VKPYHWFQGASVQQLYEQIEQYGASDVRLEVHQDGHEMYFKVVKVSTGETLPTLNDSHRCPPECL